MEYVNTCKILKNFFSCDGYRWKGTIIRKTYSTCKKRRKSIQNLKLICVLPLFSLLIKNLFLKNWHNAETLRLSYCTTFGLKKSVPVSQRDQTLFLMHIIVVAVKVGWFTSPLPAATDLTNNKRTIKVILMGQYKLKKKTKECISRLQKLWLKMTIFPRISFLPVLFVAKISSKFQI